MVNGFHVLFILSRQSDLTIVKFCMALSGILQLQSVIGKVSVASLSAWLYLVYYSYKAS